MSKTIWIDVSSLLTWSGHPVGAIRVLVKISEFSVSRQGISFCRYNDESGIFEKIDSDKILTKIDDLKNTANLVNVAQVSGHSFLGKFKLSLINLVSKHLPKNQAKLLQNISTKLSRVYYQLFLININLLKTSKFSWILNPKKIFRSTHKQCFKTNDVYINFGIDWNTDSFTRLKKLKSDLNLKVVTCCYDLIPVNFPEYYLNQVTPFFRRFFSLMLKVSNQIICISKNSESDLISWAKQNHLPVPKTIVINLGSNLECSNKSNSQQIINLDIISLGKTKYILYVSTIEARKNHQLILNIISSTIDDNPNANLKIVFAGRFGWGVDKIKETIALNANIKNHLVIFDNANDAELNYLYDHCLFTIYPSSYEGWGLPIVESLNRGKFCLCSNSSSLPEAGQSFCEYLDPGDESIWKSKINYYFENENIIETLNSQIKANYKPRTWNDFNQELMNLVTASN